MSTTSDVYEWNQILLYLPPLLFHLLLILKNIHTMHSKTQDAPDYLQRGVFMCVYVYSVYTHTHIYTYIYVYIHMHIHINTYTHTYMYITVCVFMYVCVCVCVCVHKMRPRRPRTGQAPLTNCRPIV